MVVGSIPTASFGYVDVYDGIWVRLARHPGEYWAGYPSGQRGQTVNLVAMPSQVRILFPPIVFLLMADSECCQQPAGVAQW